MKVGAPEEEDEVDLEGGGDESPKKFQSLRRSKTFIKDQKEKFEKTHGKEMVFSTYDKFSHLKYDMKELLCWWKKKDDEMENKKTFLHESEILYQEGYEAVVQ